MPELATMTVVGVIVLAVLVVAFMKIRQKDLLGAMMEKRRATSKIVSRAEYIEGMEKIPVAMALTDSTFYYENPDLDASFDLDRLDEIEYADDLSTGNNLPEGCRVLRLRSHGATFEFVMEKPDAAKWQAALPSRVLGTPAAHAV
jgi:hypothetical protein